MYYVKTIVKRGGALVSEYWVVVETWAELRRDYPDAVRRVLPRHYELIVDA